MKETPIYPHPYAFSLAKYLMLLKLRPNNSNDWGYTNGDYITIADNIGIIGDEHLKRILLGKRPATIDVLNRLVKCFPPTIVHFNKTWQAFSDEEVGEFELREKRHEKMNKPYGQLSKELKKIIDKAAYERMLHFLGYIKVINLPDAIPLELSLKRYKFRKVRNIEEINVIFDFARGVGSNTPPYEDAELNGPEIKGPWLKRNRNAFHIITQNLLDDVLELGDLKANINILPITQYAYESLKNGRFKERDIAPEHVIPPEEKHNVDYLFVEGINGFLYATYFLTYIEEIIESLAEPKPGLKISAIGGTPNGERLMSRLGFVETGKYIDGTSAFLEVDYATFKEKIREILIRFSSKK